MQVEYDNQIYYGFGANTDIIAASVEAYIDCINKTSLANSLNSEFFQCHVTIYDLFQSLDGSIHRTITIRFIMASEQIRIL